MFIVYSFSTGGVCLRWFLRGKKHLESFNIFQYISFIEQAFFEGLVCYTVIIWHSRPTKEPVLGSMGFDLMHSSNCI